MGYSEVLTVRFSQRLTFLVKELELLVVTF